MRQPIVKKKNMYVCMYLSTNKMWERDERENHEGNSEKKLSNIYLFGGGGLTRIFYRLEWRLADDIRLAGLTTWNRRLCVEILKHLQIDGNLFALTQTNVSRQILETWMSGKIYLVGEVQRLGVTFVIIGPCT